MEEVLPPLKSQPDLEIPVKFWPERSGRIPCIPFRVKASQSQRLKIKPGSFSLTAPYTHALFSLKSKVN